MPESEIIITINNDEEMLNTKDMDGNTSLNSTKTKRTRLTFPFGACRVCSDSATGIHYGIATCEGCKGFFKRSILRKEKYRCYFDNTCLINMTNRNRCKACRFRRCIDEGMSVDGVKMGRIPKLVKERALKELKEQKMKEEAALAQTDETHPRTESCSSISDRSIENYDPNAMETDFVDSQDSSIQEVNDNFKHKNILSFSSDTNSSIIAKGNPSFFHRTKYPTFLPNDFTADESVGVTEQLTGYLNDDVFQHVKTIAKKLSINQFNLSTILNEDEMRFIRYLRWASHNIFIRRSKRLKQLVARMNHMIDNNINEYPGDNATLAEFFHSIRLTCEVYTPASVLYIQELPGMKNICLTSLQKMISHRSFDWYLIKNYELYQNNQGYFLAPNGFQYTRYWMDELHGSEVSNGVFHVSKCLRELNLNENEFSLVIPLHMCYSDPTMKDQETIQMLRSCYLYALYTELSRNRGENEGKLICNKILKILELIIPLNDLYQSKIASLILDV